MSIWERIGYFVSRVSASARTGAVDVAEAVRTVFAGDPELRKRVAFSVAMIALSAKMAKADGVVSQAEIRAFQEIFHIPAKETRNVARLYDLAKSDVAGFEAYAERMAGLCGSGRTNCGMLEDILDGLFHIAKADGVMHEREGTFLRRIAEIFMIDEAHYQRILARHLDLGDADPYTILGIEHDAPFEEVRKHYRKLVANNHPDRLIARGLPQEFIAIATTRLAAINAAYELIEKGLKAAV
jgi:DnaJ like chaperone protein